MFRLLGESGEIVVGRRNGHLHNEHAVFLGMVHKTCDDIGVVYKMKHRVLLRCVKRISEFLRVEIHVQEALQVAVPDKANPALLADLRVFAITGDHEVSLYHLRGGRRTFDCELYSVGELLEPFHCSSEEQRIGSALQTFLENFHETRLRHVNITRERVVGEDVRLFHLRARTEVILHVEDALLS